jgi:pimeloyl-ACP methyl ester carboxylesterase
MITVIRDSGMKFTTRLVWLGSTMAMLAARLLRAEESPSVEWTESLGQQMEDSMIGKTLGGRQFWGDVYYFRGWRIQQNVFTKHHRLIDPNDVRHSWGSYEECQKAFELVREKLELVPPTGPAVILIHGLMQSSKSMASMRSSLQEAGFSTIVFDYPSSQVTIPEAAKYLDRMIQSLEGYDELNFVVHSMGGLVVRAYTAEYSDPRIKRMVMLGTPNHGAELADITQRYWIVRTAAGPGARQLVTKADGLIPKLPVPNFEFAVIAGSRGNKYGWNPLIPGDDDGTVTVASTRLKGAADFTTVRALHSRLLWNEVAISHTVNFIKDGRLNPEGLPRPIGDEDETLEMEEAVTTGASRDAR